MRPLPILILLITVAATPSQLRAELPVQVGDSHQSLRRHLGTPSRSIDTGDGQLHFYDNTLVFVRNGVVDFISLGAELPPGLAVTDTRRPPAPALAPASVPPPAAPAPAVTSAASDPFVRSTDSATLALRESTAKQQQFASRTRRFAITRAHATLYPNFRRRLPLIYADAGATVRDARGHLLPAYGDSAWPLWYAVGVTLDTTLQAD